MEPVEFDIICTSNPRVEIEEALQASEVQLMSAKEAFESLAIDTLNKKKQEEQAAAEARARKKGVKKSVSKEAEDLPAVEEPPQIKKDFSINEMYNRNTNQALSVFTTSAQDQKRKKTSAPTASRLSREDSKSTKPSLDLKIMISKSPSQPDKMAPFMYDRTITVRHLMAWLLQTKIKYDRKIKDRICNGLI